MLPRLAMFRTIKDEMIALEARKTTFNAALAEPPLPALHPRMARGPATVNTDRLPVPAALYVVAA